MSLFILEFLVTLPPQLNQETTSSLNLISSSNTHNLPRMKVSGYTLLKDLSLRYKVQVGKRCIKQVEVSIFVDSPGGGGGAGAETCWKLDKCTHKNNKTIEDIKNLGVAKSISGDIWSLINNAWECECVTLIVP